MRQISCGSLAIYNKSLQRSFGEYTIMLAALKWGALVGVTSYVVANVVITALGLLLFPHANLTNPGLVAFACLSLFLLLFAFSTAGYFTGRETLRSGLGAAAGVVALAIYAVLSAIYTPGGHAATSTASGATANAIAQGVAALIVLGIAALMGWLGGRPGAQNAKKRKADLAAASVIDSAGEQAKIV